MRNPLPLARVEVLVAVATAVVVACFLLATAWHDVPNCRFVSDSEHYIHLAEGNPQLVPKPFCNRVLQSAVVRATCYFSPLDIHQAFLITGIAALFTLAIAVALNLPKSPPAGMVALVAATLCSPIPYNVFMEHYRPDLFHAALIAVFFLFLASAAARPKLSWAVYVTFLLAWIARESTLLLSACLVVAGIVRRKWWQVVLVLALSVMGIAIVAFATRGHQPNIHHVNELTYLAGKSIFNFTNNMLGIRLWSNTYAACNPNYPLPIWTMDLPSWLRFGSMQSIGICQPNPLIPLDSILALLTIFGVAPTVLVAILKGDTRQKLKALPPWLAIALGYGILAYIIGPVTAQHVSRMSAYGWPAFWIATPHIFMRSINPTPSIVRRLLACHLLAVWAPTAVFAVVSSSVVVYLALLVGIFILHILTFRIIRNLLRAT